MPECIAIRHLHFEDLGYFEEVLLDAGWIVRYVDAPLVRNADIEGVDPELLIVLGAPVGANDEGDYPFLAAELALLETRLSRNQPTLGICLGAQLMARASGANVAAGVRSEIGWAPLLLLPTGTRSPLRHFEDSPVFHWHGDVFDLPEFAVPLAATPDCPHQAFAMGPNVLGLQFHPEVTAAGLEPWYVGHYRNLNASGISVNEMRTAASLHAPSLRERGERMLREWLGGLEI